MSDDVVDLTISDDELPAPPPAGGGAAGPSKAGPSRPARAPSPDLVAVDATQPCVTCGGQGLPVGAACQHNACAACLAPHVLRSAPLCWPPPHGAGGGVDTAFAAFSCPQKGCSAPLSLAALRSALPPPWLRLALRWAAACTDAFLHCDGARDCPSCGSEASVPAEAGGASAASAAPPAAKGTPKGKAKPKAGSSRSAAGVCRECGEESRACGACGAMLTAAPHACDAGRLRTLALLRALSNLRAAYYQPGGAGAGSAGGKRKRSTPGAGSGVGYGGSAGAPTKAQKAALAKAQGAQVNAAAAAVTALEQCCEALEAFGTARAFARAPLPAQGALSAGGAAPCLAALLRAASLFDSDPVGAALLRAALRLVGCMTYRADLLPLLCLPSAAAAAVAAPGEELWSEEESMEAAAAAAAAAADEEAEAAAGEDSSSVAELLHALAEQAEAVLAAGGGRGGEESALAEEVKEANELLRNRARAAGGGLLTRRRRRPAAGAAGGGKAEGGAAAAASEEADYAAVMGKQCFDSAPLLATHYYKKDAAAMGGGVTSEAGKQRMRRIAREAAAMRSGLPCHFGSCVAVRVDEDRSDVLQVLIVPHKDTPYGNGVFIFDVLLPVDYPNHPPKVQLLTTGGGRVRFNPNLYAEGKVCLSLLGTWKGPGWDPSVSTLLQVLVSIQSLIFVEKPWFNEPGYEKTEGTPEGERQAAAYSAQVRADCLQWSLLPALRAPPPAFNAFLVQHFRRKQADIKLMLREWSEAAKRSPQMPGVPLLLKAASECEDALQRFAPRIHSGPVETIVL